MAYLCTTFALVKFLKSSNRNLRSHKTTSAPGVAPADAGFPSNPLRSEHHPKKAIYATTVFVQIG